METQQLKQPLTLPAKVYDYESLGTFFEDVASPKEIENHLDQLLYFLIYYEHNEGVHGFYQIYSDIFELKEYCKHPKT